MQLKQPYGLCAVLGLLAISACDSPSYDKPPANSYRVDDFALEADGASRTIRGAVVTPAFFPATKAPPFLGRLFVPEEYQSGRDQIVVLSGRLWQQKFKGDPGSIGKTLRLNGRSLTIVGIMPPTFDVPSGADLWLPNPEPTR